MDRLPFRTRLTLANAALLAAALLVFTAIAYATIEYTIRTSLNTRLQATAMGVQHIPDVHHGHIAFDPDDRAHFLDLLNDNHVNGATVALDGTLVLSNLQRPPQEILKAIARTHQGAGSVHAASGDVDYLSFPVTDRHGRVKGYAGAWESRRVYDNLARSALLSLLGTSVFVILAAVGIGIIVARRTMKPVAEM